MKRIITIGSSVVDIFVHSDEFTFQKTGENGLLLCQQYGKKLTVDDFNVFSGGGGSNTGVGFKRMGFSVAVVSELGKDMWSQFITEDLKKELIDVNLLIKERKEQTGGSVILVGNDGGRTILVHRGASSMLEPRDIPKQHVAEAEWVHMTSLGGTQATLEFVLGIIRKSSVGLSWNPGKDDLRLLAEGKMQIGSDVVEILLVNREEWQILEPIREEIMDKVRVIVITHGKLGGQIFKEGSLVHEYGIKETKAVDETGAGDAFGVGFVSAYLRNKSMEACSEWGKFNSASVVSKVGAKSGLMRVAQMAKYHFR